MKKISGIFFAALMAFSTTAFASPDTKKEDFVLGKTVKFSVLDQTKTYYALEKSTIDVNGDKVPDQFLLVGTKKDPESLLVTDVHVVVIDGKTGKEFAFLYRPDASYSPKVYFGDLTGDKIPEIITEFPTSQGDEKIYMVGSFKNNEPKLFLGPEGIQQFFYFTGKFDDNFTMLLTNTYLKETAPVTLLGYKKVYINDGVYDKKGKLLKEVATQESKLAELILGDRNQDGVKELYGYTNISGISLSDVVAKVEGKIEFVDGEFKLTDLNVCGSMYQYQ